MHGEEAFIAFFLITVGLPIVCGTLICLVKILRGGGGKKRRQTEAEEARLIQQIHRDVTRLESRIESIETIVMEYNRKKGDQR